MTTSHRTRTVAWATIASAMALAGCVAAPPIQVQSTGAIPDPGRVRAWAFAPEVLRPELAPVRDAVAGELRRVGWLEAPFDEAEVEVRFSVKLGDWRTVEVDEHPAYFFLDMLSLASTGAVEPRERELEDVRTARLWVALQPAGGQGPLLFEGAAERRVQDLLASRSAAPLARAALAGFLSRGSTRGRVEWPARDDLGPAPASGSLPPPAVMPERADCPGGLAVVVAAGAPIYAVAHRDGGVKGTTTSPSAGCVHAPASSHLHRVTFTDGRRGWVPLPAVAYHPARPLAAPPPPP